MPSLTFGGDGVIRVDGVAALQRVGTSEYVESTQQTNVDLRAGVALDATDMRGHTYPSVVEAALGPYVDFDIPDWASIITIDLNGVDTDGGTELFVVLSDNANINLTTASVAGNTSRFVSGVATVAWAGTLASLTDGMLTVATSVAGTAQVFISKNQPVAPATNYYAVMTGQLASTDGARGFVTGGKITTTNPIVKMRVSTNAGTNRMIAGTIAVTCR